jgi:hypothetical protein
LIRGDSIPLAEIMALVRGAMVTERIKTKNKKFLANNKKKK